MSDRGTGIEGRFALLQGLPFRVVAFLSLALLPIGLLAIWQTQNLDAMLRARTDLSLVALTELAASGERQALQRAVGAADSLAVTYLLTNNDPPACDRAFAAFQAANPIFSFAGFFPASGVISCSSGTDTITVTDPNLLALTGSEMSQLISRTGPPPASEDLAVLMQPVRQNGGVIGQIVLALPTETLVRQPDASQSDQPLSLTIFNKNAQIIAVTGEPPVAETIDASRSATTRLNSDPTTFTARNDRGQRRIFVTLTMVPDLAYVTASWTPTEGFLAANAVPLPSFFLPSMMWLASLLVAYFAVHRLVVGPIQALRKRMRDFGATRALPPAVPNDMLPQELYDLDETFVNMAYDLIDDEAQMENSLREKNVLLKEVHHRVKNNLQMISSIMNMQIRKAGNDESRRSLRRLQDRVLGLATVHRFIYQSENLGRTEAAPLMSEICNTVFNNLAAVQPQADRKLDIDNFGLVPDQALPLALLVGEVGSNAVKHMSRLTGGDIFLHFTLRIVSPGVAQFRCRNSAVVNTALCDQDVQEDGIGRHLIRAFSLQLGGEPDIVFADGIHMVSVSFPITQSVPDALDY